MTKSAVLRQIEDLERKGRACAASGGAKPRRTTARHGRRRWRSIEVARSSAEADGRAFDRIDGTPRGHLWRQEMQEIEESQKPRGSCGAPRAEDLRFQVTQLKGLSRGSMPRSSTNWPGCGIALRARSPDGAACKRRLAETGATLSPSTSWTCRLGRVGSWCQTSA